MIVARLKVSAFCFDRISRVRRRYTHTRGSSKHHGNLLLRRKHDDATPRWMPKLARNLRAGRARHIRFRQKRFLTVFQSSFLNRPG